MVTSWGTACGIAEYSKYLMDAAVRATPVEFHVLAPDELMKDHGSEYPVTRCWRPRSSDFRALVDALREIKPDLVHIQFQWAYYSSKSTADLIAAVKDLGLPVMVTFHTTSDLPDHSDSLSRVREALAEANLLLVHTADDVELFAEWGLDANVRLAPIGNFIADDEDPVVVREALGLSAYSPIIASFGFLQTHKGIMEAIESVALLRETHPDILYVAVSAVQQNPQSKAYRTACLERARELGIEDRVIVMGRFLANEEVIVALHAADIIVLPYHPTGESASGALTFALSSRRPVVTTAQPIFDTLSGMVRQIASPDPALIASAVEELLGRWCRARSARRRRIGLHREDQLAVGCFRVPGHRRRSALGRTGQRRAGDGR